MSPPVVCGHCGERVVPAEIAVPDHYPFGTTFSVDQVYHEACLRDMETLARIEGGVLGSTVSAKWGHAPLSTPLKDFLAVVAAMKEKGFL